MKKIFIFIFILLFIYTTTSFSKTPPTEDSSMTTTIPPSLETDSLNNVLYHNENLNTEHLKHYKMHNKQSYRVKSHSFFNKTQLRVNDINKYLYDLSQNNWKIEEDASDTIFISNKFQGDYHGFIFGKHWEEKCEIDMIYYRKDKTTYIINFKNIKHFERRKSDQHWLKKEAVDSEEKCLELIKINK